MSARLFYLLAIWLTLAWAAPGLRAAENANSKASASAIAGKWTYRSFHNNPSPVGDDPRKALSLIFAEAAFTFEPVRESSFAGTIDWGGGGLDLQGVLLPGAGENEAAFQIVGTGRPGTQTEGWRYDYFGQLAHKWSNGVNQTPALVGSVIRVNRHNGAPAGYVASFIAVKQPEI
jgi:hypothetical protein